MVSVERNWNGFKVRISEPGTGMRGYSVLARDMDEAKLALEHYYPPNGGNKKHPIGGRNDCPLCRLIQKEHEKTRKPKRRTKQQIMLDALAEM